MKGRFYKLDAKPTGLVSGTMKRLDLLFALLALFLVPSSAFAHQEARLNPSITSVRVGETRNIEVGIHHMSGLNITMWRFVFHTPQPNLISLAGIVDYQHPVWSGTIHVTGLAPGTAEIVSGSRLYAVVEVTCGFVEPVSAIAPVIAAKKGEPVKLAVTASTETGRVLQWYAGRDGDTSRPLASAGDDLTITPPAAGTHYVWVSAQSACAASSAEFRIDVANPRRRAAGHGAP
jgi:hypothetical protein